MEITRNSLVRKNENELSANLDGKVVAMSINEGIYYNFDEIASSIWERLNEPIKVIDLCNQLMDEFEVQEEQCFQDVLTFLQRLDQAGFLEVN